MAVIEELRGELAREREAHQSTLRELVELRTPFQHDSTLPGPRLPLTDRTWMALIDKDRAGLPVCCSAASALRDIIIGFAQDGGEMSMFDEGQQRSVWHTLQGFLAMHEPSPALQAFSRAIEPLISMRARSRYTPESGPESQTDGSVSAPIIEAEPVATDSLEREAQQSLLP